MEYIDTRLETIKNKGNYRVLPTIGHEGKYVVQNQARMLNLSSNDYLGLANDIELRKEFLETISADDFLPSASSSRLLTGNHHEYALLEQSLCKAFNGEAALVFNSGYHANMGILPAVSNNTSLILADKFVHASLIDGIRLCDCKSIRYRHNDYAQLERLIAENHQLYETIIVVTESIFSMDGDEADLNKLVGLKKQYPNVMLYVDEAHAIGVRGTIGLGCAEQAGCIQDIDFLVGTFGKAIASVGAYVICSSQIRDLLINTMRTLIFTTGLPPVNLRWTRFVIEKLPLFADRRSQLEVVSTRLREYIPQTGQSILSTSHIIPFLIGDSNESMLISKQLQREGFYVLPVRPPTVPEGTSRLRFSLTADINMLETESLINRLTQLNNEQ